MLIQQTSEIYKINSELKFLNENLKKSLQILAANKIKTVETVKENSYLIVDLMNSPVVFLLCKNKNSINSK